MHSLKQALTVVGLLAAYGVLGADAAPNVQLAMLTKVNPQGLALWDITNNAIGDDGELDAKLIKTADWAKLIEIGTALQEGGKTLSDKGVIAALPGAKLQDEANEGASKAADVQRYIDAQPQVFAKFALELQKTGASVIDSAQQRDTKKLNEIAGKLDSVCENCHVEFWYPQQKKK